MSGDNEQCQGLWAASMKTAFEDLLITGTSRQEQTARYNAVIWIRKIDHRVCGFDWACGVLDIDPVAARERAETIISLINSGQIEKPKIKRAEQLNRFFDELDSQNMTTAEIRHASGLSHNKSVRYWMNKVGKNPKYTRPRMAPEEVKARLEVLPLNAMSVRQSMDKTQISETTVRHYLRRNHITPLPGKSPGRPRKTLVYVLQGLEKDGITGEE